MRSLRHRRRRRKTSDSAFQAINITPFTDVLLVLLIIFLIAGSSLAPTGVDVDELSTANAQAGQGDTEEKELLLFVASGGELTLVQGGRARNVELADIPSDGPLNLTAAPATPVEEVVKVYDQLLRSGYNQVKMASPQTSPLEL